MNDKVIVTHSAALRRKYGTAGVAKIRAALAVLLAADAARGVRTRVVYLDQPAAMKKLACKPVGSNGSARAFKEAIDGVHKKLSPDYLLILGAPDVVPHQDVTNPAFGSGDDDPVAWSDLPYACDAPYSRDPASFVGPTRVVSRLPDLFSATEPSHLLALLKTAAQWRKRPASDYSAYFALSAAVWRRSTEMSLTELFGSDSALQLSPPSGPKHTKHKLRARAHFINCHGAPSDPTFYGEGPNSMPPSLSTRAIAGSITEGTLAAVECCYGGELYDSVTLGLDLPICHSYLRQGAYAYLGSTTISYGPSDDNGAADLVCQYFLAHLMAGASVGRAGLMARQQFVEKVAQMDPIDLKTLAQFCVYGDPSVHPVEVSTTPGVPKSTAPESAERFFRNERRAKLKQVGAFLQATKPTASKQERTRHCPAKVRSVLARIATQSGMRGGQQFAAFKVKGGAAPARIAAKAATAPSRYHVAIGRPRTTKDGLDRVCVVAKEVGGRIIGYRVYHRR